jgi:hypothetical protein
MKKFFKRLFLYVITPLIGLFFLIATSLVLYYHSLYKPEPVVVNTDEGKLPVSTIEISNKPTLLPVPKVVTWTSGNFIPGKDVKIQGPAEDIDQLAMIWQNRMNGKAVPGGRGAVRFLKNNKLAAQAYKLKVKPNSIDVEYSTLQGAFYSLTTLKQLAIQSHVGIPCVEIADQPDLQTRGAMLDVSRGKVPKLETLYSIVDLLTDLKYNHLQLYIEGFSFGYPSFKQYWEKTETPLLPEEIRALDQYCHDRFIELVPNQNALGHMQDWLKQDDLRDLAECPEGYKLLGLIEVKTTLSPTEPRSLELVKQMSEDLLPNFTSTRYNVNLDEPFELGKSKQRPIEDPRVLADLYMDYAKKLNVYAASKNKKMMMWGDVVSRTPEITATIPHDITLLEWRYEAIQPFDQICKEYQRSGLNYMVCPGTSSWSSYTGRTDNMLGNISNAIESAVKYSAEGMLITDWGDTPHLQYPTVSYPAFAWGGALSWNFGSKENVELDRYLSKMVFRDSTGNMGNLVMNLGRYNQFEEYTMMAMTTSNLATRFGMMDKVMLQAIEDRLHEGIFELATFDSVTANVLHKMFANPKPYRSEAALHFMATLEAQLAKLNLEGEQGSLIMDEYKNNIQMVKLAILLKQYILHKNEQDNEKNRETLHEMKALCAAIIPEHERLWMERNKRSGYKGSIEGFEKLQVDIDRQLDLLDSNLISRWANRTAEKMISAGAAFYVK